MKQLSFLFGFVCLIAMLVPACAPAPEPEPAPEPVFDQAAEEAAVREVLGQFETAYNSHDEKAVAALWGDTAIEFRRVLKGREEIEKRLAGIFERNKRSVEYKILEELGFTFLTPEVALVRQRGVFTNLFDADGKPLPDGNELVAWLVVKKDDKWVFGAILESPIEE